MKKLLWLLAFLFFASGAQAQFSDQRQYVGESGGTANAQTLAIGNYGLNAGVVLRFVPSFTNTSALTLNVNATGAVAVEKATPAGLLPLVGGEVQSGVLAQVVFDGAQYELLPPISNWCGASTGSANIQACNNVAYFNAYSGQTIYFLAGATNTGALTLNGYPVDKDTVSGAVALTGGEVVSGNIIGVTYDASISAFHLLSYPVNQAFGTQTSLASAATTDLGTISSRNVAILGVTPITSFGSSASVASPLYLVQFAGSLQITESAALLTPSLGNITTQTGDTALALYLGSGNWQIVAYFAAASAQPYVQPPQFRLSTTSGNPVSQAVTAGVSTVYAVPYNGNLIPLWNGFYFVPTVCPQLSNVLANSATGNAGPAAVAINSVYDLFAWNNAGVCTLTRSAAWTSITTPANAPSPVSGILTNSVAITNGPGLGYGTYLGTIATDASYEAFSATVQAGGTSYTDGETVTLSGGTCTPKPTFMATVSGGVVQSVTLLSGGSCTGIPSNPVSTTASPGTGLKLNVTWTTGTVVFNPSPAAAAGGPANGAAIGIWNEYNRLLVTAEEQDNTASWTWNAATWHAADASNNNRITFVSGEAEDSNLATYICQANAATGVTPTCGIGLDSTSAVIGGIGQVGGPAGLTTVSMMAQAATAGLLGRHYFQAEEFAPSGTVTFYGATYVGSAGQAMQLSAQLRY